MKHRKFWLVGAIALLCAIGFGISGHTKAVEPERWEFQTQHGAPAQLAGFNALGAAGWELAAVQCQDSNHCAFFFKRRK
ncbi:MAG TPA: hypothetical protein VFZ40_12100 [Pyrinomonadaceae bacterium]